MEAKYIKDYHPNLLSWNELAYLINIRPLMTKERVKLLDPQKREFKWKCTGWHRNPDCYPPSLIRLLLDEMVIYFTDMSRATKNLNDFASKVEDEYQKQTDAHIYVCQNPELEHPFGAHYDDAHNIIVQCEGQTHFKIWKEVENKNFEKGANLNLDLKEDPILDIVMNPGDALWVPMFFPHHAISLTPRLSVSFPFTPRGSLTKANEDRNWITL